MKVLTITGTRPELIRLSVILQKLDALLGKDHVHIYTNQNFDFNLSTIFISDLGLRQPDYVFTPSGTLGEFLGNAFTYFETVLNQEHPDKILILGDTNSALLSILAAKREIPIYHMEAGNRCYDSAVPEELNRRLVDTCATYNLPYTKNSKENLIREGYHKNFVFQIGNPIKEVLQYYKKNIDNSDILDRLGLYTGFDHIEYNMSFILLSLHRSENVDNFDQASSIVAAINHIADANKIKVILPLHPRTKDRFQKHNLYFSKRVHCIDPIGFFDFVKLEQYAKVIITDSGTVPEEAALFGKPCIVLRNTTERQELMEIGSLILAGTRTHNIIQAYRFFDKMISTWNMLEEYDKVNVSDSVIRILIGHS